MRPATLSPQGTVRQAFAKLSAPPEAPGLDGLRDALGDDLFAAARELSACVAPSGTRAEAAGLRAAVLALAGACLWSARSGSTRLPIGTWAEGPLRKTLGELRVGDAVSKRIFALLDATPEARGGARALFGLRGEFRPLVQDGDAVCIQRLVMLEDDLGAHLRARLAAAPEALALKPVGAALADILQRAPTHGGAPVVLSDEQQRAVLAAVHQRLTVISGGPGTGKTSIVVSMLRLLARLGTKTEAIALAAPTGKAANRMEESILRALTAVAAPSGEDAALLGHRPAPMTLHRLLGYSPTRDSFKHHGKNPLPHEVVIVDEASMIDLALMDQLLRAVGPAARLVLLGDAEQLPSVEAGAVLRDLVPAKARRPARAWDGLVAGGEAPSKEVGEDLRNLGAVRLGKSYRMDERDPSGRAVYQVSLAVRSGVVPTVADIATGSTRSPRGPSGDQPEGPASPAPATGPVRSPRDPQRSGRQAPTRGQPAQAGFDFDLPPETSSPGPVPPAEAPGSSLDGPRLLARETAAAVRFDQVELLTGPGPERQAFLARWFDERVASLPGFAALAMQTWTASGNGLAGPQVADLERLDAHLQDARLLCLTRSSRWPSGAGSVNAVLAERLEALLGPGAGGDDPALQPGTPVLMTKNDYELGLFNGDQGLALWVQRAGEAAPSVRFAFRIRGVYRLFEREVLRTQVEPCWAMTVHKAQGSEFTFVALLLPTDQELKDGSEAEALACPEVVYTAMTRARKSVTVVGTEATLRRAVEKNLERWSALGAAGYWTKA